MSQPQLEGAWPRLEGARPRLEDGLYLPSGTLPSNMLMMTCWQITINSDGGNSPPPHPCCVHSSSDDAALAVLCSILNPP